MEIKRSILSVLLCFFFLTPLFFPLSLPASEDTLHLTTQNLEYHIPSRRIRAYGEVKYEQEGIVLRADEVEGDLTTGDITASGDVHIDLPKGFSLDTPMAELNTNTRMWKIYAADIGLGRSGFIKCDEAEQKDTETVNLTRLRFTTCGGKKPFWEIRSRKGILKLDSHLKFRHLTFIIKGMPVFYLPIIAYVPIQGKKGRGIQPPQVGNSSMFGFFIKNLYTWPLTSDTEGRLFFDIFTNTGIGLGAGWTKGKGGKGEGSEGKFYLLEDKKFRRGFGRIDISLNSGTSLTTRRVIELHTTREREFYRRFSSESRERDARIEESRAFVTHNEHDVMVKAEIENVRSLVSASKDRVYTLPKLSCSMNYAPLPLWQRFISPFAGFELSIAHRNWDSNDQTGNGALCIAQPELLIPVPLSQWLSLNSLFSSRQGYSQSSRDESTGHSRTNTLSLCLTGPRFFKDYNNEQSGRRGGTEGTRHLIYPQAEYTYKTHSGIYPLAIIEREEGGEELEEITFLIINRVWRKDRRKTPSVTSLLDLTLSQTMQLKEDKHIVTINALAMPHPLIGFNEKLNLDTKGGHGKDLDTTLVLGNSKKGEIDLSWRYQWDIRETDNVNTAQITAISMPYREYHLRASLTYDLKTNSGIEDELTLFYQSECWKGNLSSISRPDEHLIRANVDLIF